VRGRRGEAQEQKSQDKAPQFSPAFETGRASYDWLWRLVRLQKSIAASPGLSFAAEEWTPGRAGEMRCCGEPSDRVALPPGPTQTAPDTSLPAAMSFVRMETTQSAAAENSAS
jgi:hypothetical protein